MSNFNVSVSASPFINELVTTTFYPTIESALSYHSDVCEFAGVDSRTGRPLDSKANSFGIPTSMFQSIFRDIY